MLLNRTINQVKSAFNNPRFLLELTAVLLAGCLSTALPGADAQRYFLRSWYPETSAPGWVYLITDPLSTFPFQIAYALWVMLTFGLVLAWLRWRGLAAGWALASFPFVWLIYLGQIEAFALAGFMLGVWAVQRRAHPVFYGLAAVLLFSKLGVGWLPGVFLLWLAWRRGPLAGVQALGAASAVVLFSVAAVGDWTGPWLAALLTGGESFAAGAWMDGSLWPWGLLAVPVALWPIRRISPTQRLALLAAASPLAFPYLRTYHLVLALLVALPYFAAAFPERAGELGGARLVWLDSFSAPLALALISWVFLFFPTFSWIYGLILFAGVFYGIWKSTRNCIRRPWRAGRA